MTQIEILSVVEKLNDVVGAGIDVESMEMIYPFFVFDTDGYCDRVTFAGIQLWSSEDDCRNYDEATDKYEDLYDYLIKQLAKLSLETSETVMMIDAIDKATNISVSSSAALN